MNDLPSDEAIKQKFADVDTMPMFDMEPAADHSENAPKRKLPPLVGTTRCPHCRKEVGVYQAGDDEYRMREHVRRTVHARLIGDCQGVELAVEPSRIVWKEGAKVWKPPIPLPPNDLTLPE